MITKTKITLGFSPCPNDTFIFDALVNRKIDTQGIEFNYFMSDVEDLNKKALQAKPDITKLSFFAYSFLWKVYQLMDSGSALGNNCGPLLISKKEFDISEIHSLSIAVPGIYTTANFLMSFAFPDALNKKSLVFNQIENAILDGTTDVGVIIHENRFTYADKGLVKIIDLGELWESKTGYPIPLGGIAIKRSMPEDLKRKINSLIKQSVEFAFSNPFSSKEFVKQNAQELSEDVIKKHIDLYVNHYTKSLGKSGKDAINFMYDFAFKNNLIPELPEDIFITA